MADALVEHSGRAGPVRFFCHHCNVEFEDILQEYICPYCSGGFIEELAGSGGEGGSAAAGSDSMDTDSSDNLDDEQESLPFFNDLAFLMSGGRLRDVVGGAETLLQQMAWALAGGAGGRGGNAAPVLLVGAPGDYVLGGEAGLDAVVTQLLGQLEGAGPPPLPRDQLSNIESVVITELQVASGLQCSVCWDHFTLDEQVSQLACQHVFHSPCIEPWLRLHATCPICRHCLLQQQQQQQQEEQHAEASPRAHNQSRVVLQRNFNTVYRLSDWPRSGRGRRGPPLPRSPPAAASPATSSASPPATSSTSTSTTSATDTDTDSSRVSHYNMELDFD